MSDEIVKRGYLHQQFTVTRCLRRRKTWQRVFVLLKDGCLFLYESPRDLQPLQTVPLYASCCLFPQYPKVARSNCMQLETPTASVFLCADSPADIKSWAIHIQKAAILASGGSIGKLNPTAGATASAGGAAGGNSPVPPRSNMNTPQLSGRSLNGRRRSTSNADGGNDSVDALNVHSSEAAALIAEASAAAAYDRVLQRFRSVSLITSFTDSSLACLAAGGGYVKYRAQAKRRVASEWLWDTKQHAKANRIRAAAAGDKCPMEYVVAPLGSLRLDRATVHLAKGAGTLNVTNDTIYPLAVRLGDEQSTAWLQTNTPMFLAAGSTTTLQLSLLSTLTVAPAHGAASSSSSASASSPAAAAAVVPSPPFSSPSLPASLFLVCKPCDISDIESGAPHLLFVDEEGEPAHRIGEMYPITVDEAPNATSTPTSTPTPRPTR